MIGDDRLARTPCLGVIATSYIVFMVPPGRARCFALTNNADQQVRQLS
jgi:hypothetical protein